MASYGLTLVTAPTVEPVTLAEAKWQCGVAQSVGPLYDQEIKRLVEAARRKVEEDTNRAGINQTWDLALDCFPLGLEPIYIPKAPLSSVTSISYYDTAGASQTLSTSTYKVIASRQPGEIRLKYQQAWPLLYSEPSVVTVRFVAGYGSAEKDVPATFKQAILLLVNHWFENKGAAITGTIQTATEIAYQSLIDTLTVGDDFHCYAR